MAERPFSIHRLTSVDDVLAVQLNPLFDKGTAWHPDPGRRFLEKPDNLFLAARWNGTPCGFLTVHQRQRSDRRQAEVLLYEVGVDHQFQRRGIGSALIAELKRWAREVGADEL